MIVNLSFVFHVWHEVFPTRILQGSWQCTKHIVLQSRGFSSGRCQIQALLLFMSASCVCSFDGNHLPEVCDCIDCLDSLDNTQINRWLVAIFVYGMEFTSKALIREASSSKFARTTSEPSEIKSFAASLSTLRVTLRTLHPAFRQARTTEPPC